VGGVGDGVGGRDEIGVGGGGECCGEGVGGRGVGGGGREGRERGKGGEGEEEANMGGR